MAASKIDPKSYESGGVAALRGSRRVRVRCDLPLDSIHRVVIADGPGRDLRFVVENARGQRTTFCLPGTEAKDLVEALRARFGERCELSCDLARLQPVPRRLPTFRSGWALILAGLLFFGGVVLATDRLLDQPNPPFLPWPLVIEAALAGLLVAGFGVRRIAQAGHRRRVVRGREPFRSTALGWGIKIAGFTVFLGALYLPTRTVFRLLGGGGSSGWAREIGGMVTAGDFRWRTAQFLVFGLLGAGLVQLGHRIGLRATRSVLAKDQRDPILYLRAFDDDGRHDLNPGGFVSYALGLRTFGGLWRALAPVGNLSPMRILRLLLGPAGDHSEEQLAGYFRRLGPVVAISRPGEGLSTSGAARLYVDDAAWRERVFELLGRARVVILQPSDTRGVWWGIGTCVHRVPPGRLLLCLTTVAASGQAYDDFRRRFGALTGKPLPRTPGDARFFVFDDDWTPLPVVTRRRSALLWPLTGVGLDFRRMFAPFLAGLYPERFGSPNGWYRRPPWLHVPLALGIYGLGLAAFNTVAEVAGNTWAHFYDLRHGAQRTVEGERPTYRFELSEEWVTQPTDAPGQFTARTADEGFEVAVLTSTERQKDAPGLLDAFIAHLKEKNGAQPSVTRRWEFERDGRRWQEADIETVDGKGKAVTVYYQSYGGVDGSYELTTGLSRWAARYLPGAADGARHVFDGFHLPELSPAQRAVQAADPDAALAAADTTRYPIGDDGASLNLPPGWTLADADRTDTFQFGARPGVELLVRHGDEMRDAWQKAGMPSDQWKDFERDGRHWRRCQWEEKTGTGTFLNQADLYPGPEGDYGLLGRVARTEPGLDAKRLAVVERGMDGFRPPAPRTNEYTGKESAYRLRLPEAWREAAACPPPFDRFFVVGSSGEVGIGVILRQEKDLDTAGLAASIIADLKESSGLPAQEVKTQTLQCKGRTWAQFECQNDAGFGTVKYIHRVYVGPEGAYQLVGLALADEMPHYRDAILGTFDDFEPPGNR